MVSHRMTTSREYGAWQRMKTACYNKKHHTYKTYGARGIRVCSEWLESFQNFLNDMGLMPENASGIELIDLNIDFCKWNCRWVGRKDRRSLSEMPLQKIKGDKRKYITPYRITITVEKDYYDFLERVAIEKTRLSGKFVSVSTLVRMILKENAPQPQNKQQDLFTKG